MDVLRCVTTGRSVSILPIPKLPRRREGHFPNSIHKVYPRLLVRHASSSSSSSSGGSVDNQGWSPPASEFSTKITNRESSVNLESRFNPEDGNFPEQGYLGLFVRSLGLDNPAEEREEAVRALWRHSMQGNDAVDEIMKFPGILTLIVCLLPSQRIESAEAAAGLLRNISEVHTHRLAVAEAGAIEEIVGIFTRRSPALEVIQQAMRAIWNLSMEENLRSKLANVEFLSVLVAMFDSSEELEKEATAGILANLALSISNHELLVEAGVVPKLSSLLKGNSGSKNTRHAARNTLLELAKDKDIKISIIEEGLVPVPLIGADAYRSFKPLLTGLSAIPDDIKVEKSSRGPSPFGAGELLLGLRGGKELEDIDKATWLLNEGRLRQEFLARVGVIEGDMKGKLGGEDNSSKGKRITLMPWWDGIPRLVLILGLENVSVAREAAECIADIAISEELRHAVYKAGGIPHLVRLLGSGDESATESSASGLEKLAVSYKLRRSIVSCGAVPALAALLRAEDAPKVVKEKVITALARLSQTGEEVKVMIQSGVISGLVDIVQSTDATFDAKSEAENVLSEMSSLKAGSRDQIVDANCLQPLVDILASEAPSLKEKTAYVLENLASKQEHAESIVNAGLEHAIRITLERGLEVAGVNGYEDLLVIAEKEEHWLAIAAVCRLLDKVLVHENAQNLMDCKAISILLAKILKSEISLHAKDWVSACLIKLERLVGVTSSIGIPIDIEVRKHDTIPRLIAEISNPSSPLVQETAASQLRDILCQGGGGGHPEYLKAVADSGGIFVITQILDQGTTKAQEAAVAILYNLSMNEENHPALVASGCVTYLERLIKSGGPQWKLALYLLRSLPVSGR